MNMGTSYLKLQTEPMNTANSPKEQPLANNMLHARLYNIANNRITYNYALNI